MRKLLDKIKDLPWAEWNTRVKTALTVFARHITDFAAEQRPTVEEYFRHFVLPVSGYVLAFMAIGVPVYLTLFGAPLFGVIAFVTLCLLVWLPKTTSERQRTYMQGGLSVLFVLTISLGLPKANYIFQTQGCAYAASHTRFGHLTSLQDPRLLPEQREWAERATDHLATDWGEADLPPLSPLVVANMIVHSPLLVWELEWNPSGDNPEMGVYQAKSAYAGMHFDTRVVCALYDRRDRTAKTKFRSAELNRIKETTDTAIGLILPALAETRQVRTLRAATLRSQPQPQPDEHDAAYAPPPQTSRVSNAALVHGVPWNGSSE